MHTLVKSLGAVAVAGAVALAGAAPAAAANHPSWWWAQHHGNHSYVHHPYAPPAPAYYGPSYAPGYYPGYYGYGYGYDPGAAITAGIIGGIFGTIAHAAIGGSSHLARCEHAYRTYVPATNTFTGNGGHIYTCNL